MVMILIYMAVDSSLAFVMNQNKSFFGSTVLTLPSETKGG